MQKTNLLLFVLFQHFLVACLRFCQLAPEHHVCIDFLTDVVQQNHRNNDQDVADQLRYGRKPSALLVVCFFLFLRKQCVNKLFELEGDT